MHAYHVQAAGPRPSGQLVSTEKNAQLENLELSFQFSTNRLTVCQISTASSPFLGYKDQVAVVGLELALQRRLFGAAAPWVLKSPVGSVLEGLRGSLCRW